MGREPEILLKAAEARRQREEAEDEELWSKMISADVLVNHESELSEEAESPRRKRLKSN